MKSIRMKITAAILACALISAVVIGLLSMSNSSNMSNTAAKKELALDCENTAVRINALISRVEQSVDTLSDIALAQLDFSKFQNNEAYESKYTEGLMD